MAEVPELTLAFTPGASEREAERTVVGAALAPAEEPPGPDLADRIVRTALDCGWADDPRRAARHLGRLAAAKVAALAVPATALPAALVEAAGRHGVPLLTVSPDVPWSRVAQVVAEERLRETREHLAQLEQLLGHAREQGPEDRRIERLLGWLARTVGGRAVVRCGRHDSRPAEAWTLPTAVERTTTDIAEGGLRSAAIDDAGLHIRLHAIGRRRPYPVLAVGRTAPFDGRANALVTHAADLLVPLLQVDDGEADRRRLSEVAAALRVAVFQLLMGGEVTLAQRTAEGLAQGLLDAENARVYVLEGPAVERDRLALECAAATKGRALVVRCPAYDQHLIILAPLKQTPSASPDGWDTVGTTLRRLVADNPERFLGGSGPFPLSQTAGSYGDATRALAVARLQPARAALYAAESRLAEVLDPRAAAGWAAAVLRPLSTLPLGSQDQMLGTLHLGLEFPATSAGKILGVSRNTVRARLDRAAGLLGLDLSEVRARAVLHLALRVFDGEAPVPAEVDLPDVLAGEGARTWAAELLRRLAEDGRDLRATLLAWLVGNTSVEQTAGCLGLHPQTVREHLRSAERLLQRQLLSGGGGVYEVALAFAVLGELALPEC
ncbi:helix-turn-helix domain-containing protein [Kitasatospora atroaurantiaca]|uniref:helix-turn-helix domain-containing protein n=1 Tax=Kitasatospora atroaurantiaca TaxID=285545 RepID=UPI00119CF2F7|nr:helix-turn-helix domain-containing protein [Kitasatospora atroaurantiaca]